MAIDPDAIRIDGLTEFVRALKQIDSEHPKAMRLALNESAQLVVDWAQARVPRKTGRARASIKARSTRTEAKVQGGSARASYFPFLDFGGRVGRKGSVHRPYIKAGRYIYAGYAANTDKVYDALVVGLLRVVEQAGLAVNDGE